MNKILLFFIICLIQCLCVRSQIQETNIAYSDNQVRFTVITDGVIRMEWAANGQFTDAKSFVAVNRTYQKVDYKIKNTKTKVEISTRCMKMTYKKGTGRFTTENLEIISAKGMFPFTWKPGMRQKGNLKGTFRTLDGVDGDTHTFALSDRKEGKVVFDDGLLATDGWTLIDESNNFLFDNSEWSWVEKRSNKDIQDWYFMGYGHNYKQALKDFTVFAGKIPLPPRYTFGYWWSRYWSYSDNEFRRLIDDFKSYDIPLDVLVVDMDWHHIEPGKGGGTGWSWNERLFPDYVEFLKYLKEKDLKITLNLHPADGIASYENSYGAMANDLNWDTSNKTTIPWVNSDKRFMQAVFKNILHPYEKDGVDFWWLDWQQWMYDQKVDSLDNTWWLNYCFFSDMERHSNKRPLLYHRWGGLGNHRYQIGFSGDVIISWRSLDFQPYFNSTASNVLYGYWSHDIGGHAGNYIDPELYTRWMQFGALSPVMRTHSTKKPGINKEPWAFNQMYLNVLRNTIRQRYQMAPYIYAMARVAHEDGISICRPMYYDYPENAEAYSYKNEYMFGDQMLIAPITTPVENGYAKMSIWLPAGNDWYEWHTGTLLKGGQIVKRSFAIDEYPIYIKSGAILPFYTDKVKNLQTDNQEAVVVTVFPGQNGEFVMYEDHGNDKEYVDHYATTRLKSVRENNKLTVTIGAREGSYLGMLEKRQFILKVESSDVPMSVTVNGQSIPFKYDGNDLSVSLQIPETNTSKEKVIQVIYPERQLILTNGLKGAFRRFQKAMSDLKSRIDEWPGVVFTEEMGKMEAAGRKVTYHPEQLKECSDFFWEKYKNLPEVLTHQKLDKDIKEWFLQLVNWEQKSENQ